MNYWNCNEQLQKSNEWFNLEKRSIKNYLLFSFVEEKKRFTNGQWSGFRNKTWTWNKAYLYIYIDV